VVNHVKAYDVGIPCYACSAAVDSGSTRKTEITLCGPTKQGQPHVYSVCQLCGDICVKVVACRHAAPRQSRRARRVSENQSGTGAYGLTKSPSGATKKGRGHASRFPQRTGRNRTQWRPNAQLSTHSFIPAANQNRR